MNRAQLEALGLTVNDAGGQLGARLSLTSVAFNPLTRQSIDKVSFAVQGGSLLYVGPPEFVGAEPINIESLPKGKRLEEVVSRTLMDHLRQLERRSTELSALGVSPKVDPPTLRLTAELEHGAHKFTIESTRNGQMVLAACLRDGSELPLPDSRRFELSDFRERTALEDFLLAMVAPKSQMVPPLEDGAGTDELPVLEVTYAEVAAAFRDATLPARTMIEVLADLSVNGERVRFVAARIQGRTFRGLVAGPAGKIWAGRFELADFPGIRVHVASVMNVPVEQVEIVLE